MSDDQILKLRTIDFQDSLDMLSQQKTAKLATYTVQKNCAGSKSSRITSQIGETQAVRRTQSAQPAINLDVPLDGRWVYPEMYDWGKVLDDIDLNKMTIDPTSAYVQTAVASLNRIQDDLFLNAFFGTSQTGETGGTAVTFLTSNVVDDDIGASNSALNVAKILAGIEILNGHNIDLDFEEVYCGITPKSVTALMNDDKFSNADYNSAMFNSNGSLTSFRYLGINFVVSNRLPTTTNADPQAVRRLPLWCKSGMGMGLWKPISADVRRRADLAGNPAYAEASMEMGFTRIEEKKCVEIQVVE
jgi:hypothetical protein